MVLFYSDFCLHCRMLLNTIKNYDKDNTIKLVCVESVLKTGKTLPKIHSVPALLTFPTKDILFGKEVFDYLFMSGRGKLVNSASQNSASSVSEIGAGHASSGAAHEPSAFNMNSIGLSDSFSLIDDDTGYNNSGDAHRLYNWSSFSDNDNAPLVTTMSQPMDSGMLQESRTKKELPDINEYRARRDLDLEKRDMNTNTMPAAVNTR